MPAKDASRPAPPGSPLIGQWLFTHRSYVPIVILPPFLYAARAGGNRFADIEGLDYAWSFMCMGAAFIGLVIRAIVIGWAPSGTSGRNRKRQAAAVLNTTGMYSLTRNPLYFGNMVCTLGIMAAARSWEFAAIVLLAFIVYYNSIIAAEETFLDEKFARRYRRWASATPWLFPRLRGWRPPDRPFSWRKMIRDEYQTAFGIVLGIFAVETVMGGARESGAGGFGADRAWWIIFVSAALFYVVVRLIKKRTRLLEPRD